MDLANLQTQLDVVAGYLWGWPMLILLVGTGLWLTLLLRGLQFRMLVPSLIQAMKGGSAEEGRISNRSALMTALAATVGTGNIAGVATAIALGGPGAVFWMWMTGLVGMALKYGETLLGVHYRVRGKDGNYCGGPMYYLAQGAGGNLGRWMGGFYALALAFGALSVGGMVQSNAMADAMLANFGTSPTTLGGMVVLVAALIMFGGLQRIARVADGLVPAMILLYAGTGTLILLVNWQYVPGMLESIFVHAFTGHAAVGGFAGSTLLLTMRYGLARGVFANESGLGSAAIVSAAAHTKHPTEQGLVAMTQTFIDTFFVCTFTALVVLVTGAWAAEGVQSGGAALTNMAFGVGLGNVAVSGVSVGGAIVTICLFLFAFTTILGWGYYGQQGAVYLFGERVKQLYLVIFLGAAWFGAAVLDWAATVKAGVTLVWTFADVTVGLMMIPNLLALLILSPKIARLTADFLRHHKHGIALEHAPFWGDAAAAKKAIGRGKKGR